MPESSSFHIIEQTESTNNDAIFLCRSKNPPHGTALFTRFQTEGKGQRGQLWESEPNANILMSVLLKNPGIFREKPFLLSMLIATVCRQFISELLTTPVYIKWPNDLIVADRKAGGILIENIYRGKEWTWAIAGIGININQTDFPSNLPPINSLKLITGKDHDAIMLAKDLHQKILSSFDEHQLCNNENLVREYNHHLYKKGESVPFTHNHQLYQGSIQEVDSEGNLHTTGEEKRVFRFGEISWLWNQNK